MNIEYKIKIAKNIVKIQRYNMSCNHFIVSQLKLKWKTKNNRNVYGTHKRKIAVT